MIVTCPSCQARFQYDEARFQGAASKRFRCPKCSAEFEVANPLMAAPAPEPIAPPAPAPAPVAEAEDNQAMGRETTRRDRQALLAAAGALGTTAAMPPGKRFSLALLSGPYASTVRVLDKPQTVIGREEGDILTMDPETSRRHAQVDIYPEGEVFVSDLGSTNGTFVDGAPITGLVQVFDRQEFTCGKTTFMLMIRNEDTDF
jgi:predicted Zn finger-like uncharacterized protein